MANSTVYPYGTGGQLPSGIAIVNDLTTGGADKALSAEMGKKIGYAIFGDMASSSDYTEQNCSLGNPYWYYDGIQKHVAVPVTAGENIKLYNLAEGTGTGWYVFCTSAYNPPYSNRSTIPKVSGSESRIGLAFGSSVDLVAPNDAAYLILTTVDGAGNIVPWELAFVDTAVGLNFRVGELEKSLSDLDAVVEGVQSEKTAGWVGWAIASTTGPYYRGFNICQDKAVKGGTIKVKLSSYTTYKIGVVIQDGTLWTSTIITDTGWKTADIEKTISSEEAGYNIRVSVGKIDNSAVVLDDFLQVLSELSFVYMSGENGLTTRVEEVEKSISDIPQRIPMEVLGGTTYVGKKVDVSEHSYTSQILGVVGSSGQARQGCAVYGDYLFQCFNTNNAIVIFKLSTGQTIQTISLTPNASNHANSASFGQKYDSSDPFPCLYISSEGEKKTYVYRITGTEGAFVVSLVQTLSYPDVAYYYPNLHVDAPNMRGVLVGYETNSWQSANGNKMWCCCFDLPAPTSGDTTLANPYNEFSFPFIYATQGAFGRYGKLYHAFGNTSAGLAIGGFLVIDYILKNVETFVDLKGAGNFEPEGIGLWDGSIVVNSADGNIRKLTF